MGIRLVISESTAVAGSNTTTFVANANNGWTNVNNIKGAIDEPDKKISKGIDLGLGGAGTTVGVIQTADMIAASSGNTKTGFLPETSAKKIGVSAKGVGIAGGVVGFSSLLKDGWDIRASYRTPIEDGGAGGDWLKLPANEFVSAAANFFGVWSARAATATGASMMVASTGVGATVGLPSAGVSGLTALGTGLLNVGLGMLANSMDSNTTVGDVLDKGEDFFEKSWKYFNDNILSEDYIEKALEKMGDGIRNILSSR